MVGDDKSICPQKKQGLDKPCTMRWLCQFRKRCWNEAGTTKAATEAVSA